MSYRAPDEKSQRALAANSKLARLAAEGRRTREAIERKRAHEALATASKDQRRFLANTERAVSWAHVLTQWWLFVSFPPMPVLLFSTAFRAPIWVRLVLCVMASAATYLVGRSRVEAAIAREREWKASLPFELVGYFELLGADYLSGVSIGLRFQDETNHPDELLKDVYAALDTKGKLTNEGAFEVAMDSGAPFRRYVHRLCMRVLLPLHEAHPIANVVLTKIYVDSGSD